MRVRWCTVGFNTLLLVAMSIVFGRGWREFDEEDIF